MNRVIFAHGLESGPIGRKSQAIVEAGYDLLAPDCRARDLADRIAILCEAIAAEPTPPLLVGSSFGGIAGLSAAITAAMQGHHVHAIVLCAPALMLPAPVADLRPPAPTEIVHGVRDDVIPIAHSRAFAREHGVVLHEVDDDHRLAGAGLPVILAALRRLAA